MTAFRSQRYGRNGAAAVTGRARDPRFVGPIVVRQPAVASWSGAEIVDGGVPAWDGDLLVAALRGTRLYRFDLALDGSLWVLTSNRDGRGTPVPPDDRIIRVG